MKKKIYFRQITLEVLSAYASTEIEGEQIIIHNAAHFMIHMDVINCGTQ